MLRSLNAEWLAYPRTLATEPAEPLDVYGCPSGIFVKDYYCFYTDAGFGGRRLQFSETCRDTADDWGFDNQTSSWVNNDTDKVIIAYGDQARDNKLWDEPENSVNSNVGAANNDRMSAWGCRQL